MGVVSSSCRASILVNPVKGLVLPTTFTALTVMGLPLKPNTQNL
jgi:hypothetical protein